MKNVIHTFSMGILCLCLANCTPEDDSMPEELDANLENESIQSKNNQNAISIPVRSMNELIVGFKNDVDDTYKKGLRKKYGVLNFERCDCTNTRIEKWEFVNGVDIEEREGQIVQEGGVEGVDYQFYYANENKSPGLVITAQDSVALRSRIKTVNGSTTIAILDTGLDINKIEGIDPFLHREISPNTSCHQKGNEVIGWDFVNDDNDVYDDNGHGSIVTSILKSHLDASSVKDYQILPVKVFDANGTGSTFDILCGYLFATEKPEVKMMNMSFGWHKYPSVLLGRYIQQNPDVLHLASAGNSGVDTDQIKHFPSGYPLPNIISIGSFIELKQGGQETVQKSTFSNFGVNSVDFLSVGENISYYDPSEKITYPISGTSFAAPLVTSEATYYFIDGFRSPSNILNQILIHAQANPNTHPFPVKYGNIVVR